MLNHSCLIYYRSGYCFLSKAFLFSSFPVEEHPKPPHSPTARYISISIAHRYALEKADPYFLFQEAWLPKVNPIYVPMILSGIVYVLFLVNEKQTEVCWRFLEKSFLILKELKFPVIPNKQESMKLKIA